MALLSAVTTVSAHAYVKEFIIDEESYPGFDPFEPPQMGIIDQYWNTDHRSKKNTDAFVPPGSGDEIVCRKDAQPVRDIAPARAGAYVTFRYTRWQINHIGAIQTYLADCGGDCTTAIGSRLNWFKIDQAGLFPNGIWATEVLQLQGKTYTVQLPKNIKDGQYLMRHELLAFMNSFKEDQPLPSVQIYPTCTNIQITGGTGTVTPEVVQLQGYYERGAPGLPEVEIQRGVDYPLPGPPLTPGLGNTPSLELNPGVNKNPTYSAFQEKLNEPTDDNDTVPNYHLDWFARNGLRTPAPGEAIPSRETRAKQQAEGNQGQIFNRASNDPAPSTQSVNDQAQPEQQAQLEQQAQPDPNNQAQLEQNPINQAQTEQDQNNQTGVQQRRRRQLPRPSRPRRALARRSKRRS
ncbi:Endoglucanase-4 [Dactylellina cionopaga]|nr:Endoglucanase-4 [Dactylellina cionopaga]